MHLVLPGTGRQPTSLEASSCRESENPLPAAKSGPFITFSHFPPMLCGRKPHYNLQGLPPGKHGEHCSLNDIVPHFLSSFLFPFPAVLFLLITTDSTDSVGRQLQTSASTEARVQEGPFSETRFRGLAGQLAQGLWSSPRLWCILSSPQSHVAFPFPPPLLVSSRRQSLPTPLLGVHSTDRATPWKQPCAPTAG